MPVKLLALLVLLCAQLWGAYPTLRGTPTIQTSSATPVTLTFPTGTAVGDLVIVIASNENNIFNIGGGWTILVNTGGSAQVAGAAWSKVMTSGDIATGSVNVSPNGTFPGVYAIASIVGSSQIGVRENPNSQFASGASSRSITTSGAVLNSDLGIFLGAVRATGAVTISPGTSIGAPTGGMSGALYTYNIPSSGGLTITYNYASAGSGDFQIAVIIKSSSGANGSNVFPIIF